MWPCPQCGGEVWLKYNVHGGGQPRIYCSNACRQAAYRMYRDLRQKRSEGALDRP